MTNFLSNPKFSIIIPAFNEANCILLTLTSLLDVLHKHGLSSEIIVVDDGSQDNTFELVTSFSKKHSSIIVLQNKGNKGLGFSICHGVKMATGDYVSWMPADGEIPASEMYKLMAAIRPGQIIVSFPINSRLMRSYFRYTLSRIYAAALRFSFGIKAHYFNGPAFYEKKLIKDIPISSHGFTTPAEMLIRAAKKNTYGITQVPILLEKRPGDKSKAITLKNLKNVSFSLCKIWFQVQIQGRGND